MLKKLIFLFQFILLNLSGIFTQCELIQNGNFEASNTLPAPGFSTPNHTQFQYWPNACVYIGEVSLGSSANCYSGSWSLTGDHTTGNGNFLMVDIAPNTTDIDFYETNFTSHPGAQYRLNVWAYNPNITNNYFTRLDLKVNGTKQNNVLTVNNTPGWKYKDFIFTAASASTNIKLYNNGNHNGSSGKDIAIDDVCVEPIFDSIRVVLLNPSTGICTGDTAFFRFEYFGFNGGICFQINDGGALSNNTFSKDAIFYSIVNANKSIQFTANFCEGRNYQKVFNLTAETQIPVQISSSDICDGGINVVSINGPNNGSFSLIPPLTDAAIIDPVSGEISNYTVGNSYIIEYEVNNNGCIGIGTDTVQVYSPENASFTMPNFCEGSAQTIQINGTPNGIFSFFTHPMDGSTINPNSGIISNYVAGTTYSVQYKTTGFCPDSAVQQVQVITKDVADVTASDFCFGTSNTIQINGTTGGVFSFSPTPSDGAIINASSGVISNYTSGSTYSIQYTTLGVCPDSQTFSISVLDKDIALFSSANFCEGTQNNIQLLGTSGGVFSFVNTPLDGATMNSNTGIISNGTAGSTYSIKYVTPGVCKDSSTQSVMVIPTQNASFVYNDFCPGSIITPIITGNSGGTFSFNPNPNDGSTINPNNGQISNPIDGTLYFVQYATSGQCPDSSVVPVQVYNRPQALIYGSGDLCDQQKDSFYIQLNGIAPFNFSFTDGTLIYTYVNYNSNLFSFEVTHTNPFTMIDVSDNQCSGIVTGNTSFTSSDLQVTLDTNVGCPGFETSFTISSVLGNNPTCIWKFKDGTQINECNTFSKTFYEEGCEDVEIIVTADYGCKGSFIKNNLICVLEAPKSSFTMYPEIPTYFNSDIELYNTSINAEQIQWNMDGIVLSTGNQVSFELPQDSSKSFQICLLSVSKEQCKDTHCIDVKIQDDYVLYVPNTFTPDENNLNEVFLPVVTQAPEYSFTIYNRWGTIVFNTPNTKEGWDGIENGKKVEQGVYTWLIELVNYKGIAVRKTGKVLVLY